MLEQYKIDLAVNYAKAYAYHDLVYHHKSQYEKAIVDYNKAIALNPNDVGAYTNRGVAYALSGNMGRAISDFQKACNMGDENGCKGLQILRKK